MKITILGLGYVGLVQAVLFAELGHSVMGIDCDHEKITQLNAGLLPIYEPNLEMLINKHLNKTLFFSENLQKLSSYSDLIILAIGTPGNDDGTVDLSNINAAFDLIIKEINSDTLIINKSTVPVGFVKGLEAQWHKKIKMISSPEFLREGSAVYDAFNPDRIIIGTNHLEHDDIIHKIKLLYKPLNISDEKFLVMNSNSAELTKYAANAFLATKISFINEIATIAEETYANIDDIKAGLSFDPRIGEHFINAGIGFGGSCFPKDLNAIINSAVEKGVEPHLLKAVRHVNDVQKNKLYIKLKEKIPNLTDKVIAVWGLTFKPNTCDIRDAPSLAIIERLLEEGALVQAYDPKGMNNAQIYFQNKHNIVFMENSKAVLKNADALLICTEWDEFIKIDINQIKQIIKTVFILDGRNIYDYNLMKNNKNNYYSIGRSN